jgi:hypothetical protein
MAQHNNYWSCSKFADWIRGTPKAGAKTSDGWHEWETEAKRYHPVRYWIAEEGLSYLQDFVTWPVRKLYDVKYYINNRWISRTHSLTAHPKDIRPGEWCDVGNRFLPCLFNELVDYVEIELAWWHLAWSPEERPKYNMPWWAVGWWRIRTWRCPQAGLDNLKWQSELVWKEDECEPGSKNVGKPTYQAEKAIEILELYKWWKEVYPNRPDPHDVSGWSAYCDKKRDLNEGRLFGSKTTPQLEKEANRALKLSTKIEKSYEDENERMMIRLIKIRNSLWT